MSVVTNFIVTLRDIIDLNITDHLGNLEEHPRMDEGTFLISMFQAFMDDCAKKDGGGPPRLFCASEARDKHREYGPKAMESDVWIGASNYFNGSQMVEVIKRKPVYMKHLKVFAEEQEAGEFTQIWPPVVVVPKEKLTLTGQDEENITKPEMCNKGLCLNLATRTAWFKKWDGGRVAMRAYDECGGDTVDSFGNRFLEKSFGNCLHISAERFSTEIARYIDNRYLEIIKSLGLFKVEIELLGSMGFRTVECEGAMVLMLNSTPLSGIIRFFDHNTGELKITEERDYDACSKWVRKLNL
jgi:hypothetical protein